LAIDFASNVYAKAQDIFGRPITVTPLASQPGNPAYQARGIYSTEPQDDLAEEGTVFSDQRTVVDILEKEFPIPILQGDHISIPATGAIPAAGDFFVIEVKSIDGGETSLALRRDVVTKP
jgi:hypothetical protein